MMRKLKPPHITLSLVCLLWLLTLIGYGQGIKVTGGIKLETSGAVHLKVTGNEGNLAVDDDSQLIIAEQSNLSIGGDLSTNGASIDLRGSLSISGTQAQTVSANEEISVGNLTMNNSAGLTLQAPLLITGTLTLTEGNIHTTAQYGVTLSARSSFNGGSSASYIDGTFAINTLAESGGEYNFTFPVGNGSSYKPVILTFAQNNASSTTYQVRMYTDDIPSHVLPTDLGGVSPARYWKVTNGEINNFQDIEIILPITSDDGVNDVDNAKIAKSNGSVWENLGGKDISIPGFITSMVAFSTLGDFIIASSQTINPPPTIAKNTGISVSQGGTIVVSQTLLEVTDTESAPEAITYTLVSPPANGVLQKNEVFLATNGTFTQADINSGIITYVHDGEESTSDVFTFTASDEDGGTTEETEVAVTITAPGTPVANAGIDQVVVDEDNDDAEDVTLDGSASSDSGGSIESYVWRENETEIATGVSPTVNLAVDTHTIALVVTDDDGLTASDTVVITVNPQPVNNVPLLEANLGLSLASGHTVVISQNELKVTDKESSAEALTYTLTQLPANGTLQREEEDLALNNTFTQKDIDDGLIRYVNHEDSEANDSFSFTVEDENGGAIAETQFMIIISEDSTLPDLPEKIFPSVFDIGVSDNLTLSIKAEDKESGINSSRFGYVGLSSEEEIVLEEITGNDDSYSILLSSSDIDAVNDSLGIRYRFEFTNGANLKAVATGETYWMYEDNAFNSTDSPVGPWREIGEEKSEGWSISDFNIIAFPFEPQQISKVLDTLGNPDNKKWRLFRHVPGTDNFSEYGKEGFSTGSSFEQSQGYFLIMRNRDGISFGGQIAEMKIRNEDNGFPVAHELTLKNGWNLIGNPFPFAIDWQEVKNVNSDKEIGNLNRLNSSGYYDNTHTLDAFEGAFVFHQGEDISILVPLSIRLGNKSRRAEKLQKAAGWQLDIHVKSEHVINRRNGVGMHPKARDNWDIYDGVQLPKLSGYPELLIDEQDTEVKLNRSVVTEQESYIWQAEVVGGKAGEEIKLSWNSQLIINLTQGLYLWDETNSRLIDMREQAQYSFLIPKEGRLPLQIYYGEKEKLFEALDVQQLTAGLPYPNPASNMVKFPLTIPQSNQNENKVFITLYNGRGQQAGDYVFSKLPAGYHELELNLPEYVSSGLYHYQLRVDGGEHKVFSGRIFKY